MLTKKTKTVVIEEYYFCGEGPYKSEIEAIAKAVRSHCIYDGEIILSDFLNDKELLIALGEWAKQENKDAN